MNYRWTRLYQRLYRHRSLAWLLKPLAPWWQRRIWEELERDADFMAAIEESEADYEAGRWYTLDPVTHETHPNPDWPKDGPQPTHG